MRLRAAPWELLGAKSGLDPMAVGGPGGDDGATTTKEAKVARKL
jgi:hypothetical protein